VLQASVITRLAHYKIEISRLNNLLVWCTYGTP